MPFSLFSLFSDIQITLRDGIFETGAYGVPSKSQNATILSQGGPPSIQCSNQEFIREG